MLIYANVPVMSTNTNVALATYRFLAYVLSFCKLNAIITLVGISIHNLYSSGIILNLYANLWKLITHIDQ